MKKLVGLALLTLCLHANGKNYDEADVYQETSRNHPCVTIIGGRCYRDRWRGNEASGPVKVDPHCHRQVGNTRGGNSRTKAFRINNKTGHELELIIDYNVCESNKFSIKGPYKFAGPHECRNNTRRMDVWKAIGCIATRISGKIRIDEKWVDLTPWSGWAGALYGAQWEVNLNADGKGAAVKFLRHSHKKAGS